MYLSVCSEKLAVIVSNIMIKQQEFTIVKDKEVRSICTHLSVCSEKLAVIVSNIMIKQQEFTIVKDKEVRSICTCLFVVKS